MSNASVSARPIVRYQDVLAHIQSCATCKADGRPEEMIYQMGVTPARGADMALHKRVTNYGRGCAEGRRLDRLHWDALEQITDEMRAALKAFIQPLAEWDSEILGEPPHELIEHCDPRFDASWEKIMNEICAG